MKKLLASKNIHYGWAIAVYGLIVTGLAYGIAHNCFSLYIKPVTEAFGFSRRDFNVCLSIQYFIYMLISLVSGKLFRKFGVMRLMRIAAVILPVTYFCLSWLKDLPLFYLCSVIIGLMVPLLSFQAFSVLVGQWFHEKQGTVTGIVFMGSGLGGMIFNAIAGKLLENYGFAATYRILAVVMAVVLIPFTMFLLRERPEDMGLLPYGEKKGDGASGPQGTQGTQSPQSPQGTQGTQSTQGPQGTQRTQSTPGAQRIQGTQGTQGSEAPEATEKVRVTSADGILFRDAIRGISFWLVIVMALLIGYSTGSLANCIVPHISDVGFSEVYAAGINAAYLGAVSAGKVLNGLLFDRIGMKRAMYISFGLLLLGFVGIYFAQYQPLHIALVGGAAMGCAAGSVAYPLITRSVFGNRDFVILNGIAMAVGSLGGTLAPVINNAIYDSCSSYKPGFIVAAVMTVMILLIVMILRTNHGKTAEVKA